MHVCVPWSQEPWDPLTPLSAGGLTDTCQPWWRGCPRLPTGGGEQDRSEGFRGESEAEQRVRTGAAASLRLCPSLPTACSPGCGQPGPALRALGTLPRPAVLPASPRNGAGRGQQALGFPPSRCLAGAHMINDICHSVRREGWVSDV